MVGRAVGSVEEGRSGGSENLQKPHIVGRAGESRRRGRPAPPPGQNLRKLHIAAAIAARGEGVSRPRPASRQDGAAALIRPRPAPSWATRAPR